MNNQPPGQKGEIIPWFYAAFKANAKKGRIAFVSMGFPGVSRGSA